VRAVDLTGPTVGLPLALSDLHTLLQVGDLVTVRRKGQPPPIPFGDLLAAAGFAVQTDGGGGAAGSDGATTAARGPGRTAWTAVRERALPDTVGPGMRLLLVGLNPSPSAAERGYGFAGPGNRFWPAATEAGLVTCPRDRRHALVVDGVGMTDLVKRPTRGAAELSRGELGHGLLRIEALCAWLEPAVVCFAGLTGYRTARDRRASEGPQAEPLGGVPVYVMGNPSGRNAHIGHGALVEHLRAALALGREKETGL